MAFLHVFFSYRAQKGQSLLIVVLIMVVALTVGLSVAARSIINLRITTEQANSQKAFSAAEAAIEQALQNPNTASNLSKTTINGATIASVNVEKILQNSLSVVMNDGISIPQDQGVDVWLTVYTSNNSQLYQNPWPGGGATGHLTFYWGNASDCTSMNQAALEILIFTGSRQTPILNRYVYDPCQTRATQNNFTFVSSTVSTIGGQKFYYKTNAIPVTNGLIARVTPIYTGTTVAVATNPGDVVLPPQGQIISATAYTTGNELNATYRKLTYFQSFDSIPSELFYGILVPK